ncbi:MAG: hypothetical protein QXP58_07020 [Thermoprotei archaeon]
MPTPDRRYVRAKVRWSFLVRMYAATGISAYNISLYNVLRFAPDIPLYSVRRLQHILYGPWDIPFSNYDYYFKAFGFQDNYEHRVADARRKVEDWRGIP